MPLLGFLLDSGGDINSLVDGKTWETVFVNCKRMHRRSVCRLLIGKGASVDNITIKAGTKRSTLDHAMIHNAH